MKVVIDTHIFLWYISGSNDLSEYYKDIISDPLNDVYLSVASIWECVVKQGIGKLSLPQPAAEYLISKRNEHLIESMSISESSFVVLQELPYKNCH